MATHTNRKLNRTIVVACVGLVASAALSLAACTTVEYYWQGIRGQIELLQGAKPVPQVVASEPDPALKLRLERALSIREFASRELALPDNGSYRNYANLGRRFVLWNVFATPELSLTPRQWCFPVAGCVNYRGYFGDTEAREEAAKLAAAGDDVYIGGVPAYSTLGYFSDPLLSTFIRYPEPEVARLIFHELAHQVAYAKDDSVFNESFAVTVEEEGVRRWLDAQHDAAMNAQFASTQRYREGFRMLVQRARSRLIALYASNASDADKRAGKTAAFAAMREDYDALKRSWGGSPAYDYWFAQGPNNASLAAVALYSQKVPQFRALLLSQGGDLRRFYSRVKALAVLPKPERDSALAAIAAKSGVTAGLGAPQAMP